ncbi:hypothetical protein M153_24230002, partial [Pseudoloma neurophilia]
FKRLIVKKSKLQFFCAVKPSSFDLIIKCCFDLIISQICDSNHLIYIL